VPSCRRAYALAEYAYRYVWQAMNTKPGLGAEHLDTLATWGNLALVLRDLGRLEEAELNNQMDTERLT
jgi:hypothetical protein